MEEEKGYKGWKNYPTWAIKRDIDNDIEMNSLWKDRARDFIEKGKQFPIMDLAEEIEETYEEDMPTFEINLWGDLLGSMLDIVKWDEIAESIINEVKNNE